MERWAESVEILEYWFGPDGDGTGRSHIWFASADARPAIDDEIRAQFGRDWELAAEGRHDEWAVTARGRLALILLLDQFSRSIHRDTRLAYSQDPRAQRLCIEGIERGLDRRLMAIQRWFFYMPLMHAEDLDLQERSVHCFRQLCEDAPEAYRKSCESALEHALQHRDDIRRFGRFPYRNELLGRASTGAELRYLADRSRAPG